MKNIKYSLLLIILAFQFTACNEWLSVLPENEQVSDEYWTSKEEVESVLASGYVYLRDAVPQLIDWSELRGSCIYQPYTYSSLQNFQVDANDDDESSWAPLYKVINMANAVIANAATVQQRDETFDLAVMNSYLTEAYFLRALSYFYIVRNWRDAPLVLEPYETDAIKYEKAKSSDTEIIAQIKLDIQTALATGAAKLYYEDDWATKGRATQWALNALMADVCLWSEDYTTAILNCNEILNATSAFRPVFVSDPTKWFELYYPGNSNESIFEINWNQSTYSQSNSLATLFGNSTPQWAYTNRMLTDWISETDLTGVNSAVRSLYGGYLPNTTAANYANATTGYVWKYTGIGLQEQARNSTTEQDPNFIVYRVAEVMLMKAEALIAMTTDTASWGVAVDLINQIRTRSNLPKITPALDEKSQADMLEYVLDERKMELAAEGKRWYDLLRFGKRNNFENRYRFLIEPVMEYNNSANSAWIRSVLSNDNALYLPIEASELVNNKLLTQNPYYEATN